MLGDAPSLADLAVYHPLWYLRGNLDADSGLGGYPRVLAWMAFFIMLVFLLGFPTAVPLFIFGYLFIAGRESWLLSTALALIAWGAFYLLFQKLLHFPFDAGVLTGGGL